MFKFYKSFKTFCKRTGSDKLGDNQNADVRIYSSLVLKTLSMQLRIIFFNLPEICQPLFFEGIIF